MNNNKIIIFGTSTPRSGSALTANILSAHKNVIITKDLIHFFRHIFKKYSPINKKSNQYRLIYEMCLRIKIRQKISLNPKILFKKFERVKNYSDVLTVISEYILSKNKGKNLIGESANGEWRQIENFLSLNSNFKSYQVIRDPRAVLMSWKNLTFSKGYKYLNILFNWIDAINYSEKYLKKYPRNRYMRIRFEDIHGNPKKISEKLSKFLKIKVDKNMFNQKIWPKLLKNKFNYINVSAYSNKSMFGFSKKRTINWKKHIEPWELALTQFLFKKEILRLGYKLIKYDKKLVKKGLEIIQNDNLLRKNYKNYMQNRSGTDKRLNDPSNPKNWGAVDTSKNISAKFIDTKDYKIYIKSLQKIKQASKKFK